MLYLRICFDRADAAGLRAEKLKSHREYIASYLLDQDGVRVVQAGPMGAGDDPERTIGSFLVIEAQSLRDAERFHREDPFTRAGLFERADVVRWDRHIGNPGQNGYVP